MEHIPYGEETGSFHEALKGNAANFERKLERVWVFHIMTGSHLYFPIWLFHIFPPRSHIQYRECDENWNEAEAIWYLYYPTFRWGEGGRWQEGKRVGRGLKLQTSILPFCHKDNCQNCKISSCDHAHYIHYISMCSAFICYARLEEAVAGLKEGEAEVEGVLKKLERGNEAVTALKNKVR